MLRNTPLPYRFAVAATAALGLALAGCGGDPASENSAPVEPAAIPIPAASVGTATLKTFSPEFSYPAVIEPIQQANARVDLSARIKAINFTAGDRVEEGDLLVEFDDTEARIAVQSAEAALEVARATAQKAANNWKRAQELRPAGNVSEQMFDEARAADASARAEVARAEAALAQAQTDLGYTKLYASFSGKISRPNYAVGDFFNGNSPTQPAPLFQLVQLDPIYATGSVELARYVNFMLVRQQMSEEGVEIPELTVQLELPGGHRYPHEGTFEGWDNTSTATSGTIAGRIRFPNPDGLLLPGQNVVLKGQTVTPVEAPVIPQRAVLQDQQGHYVILVDADGTVQRRNIEVGIRTGQDWAVRSGLEAGERIVLEGGAALRPGTAVTIVDEG